MFNYTTPKMAIAHACTPRGVAGIDVLWKPFCDRDFFLMSTYTKEFVVFTKDFVKKGPRKICRLARNDDL